MTTTERDEAYHTLITPDGKGREAKAEALRKLIEQTDAMTGLETVQDDPIVSEYLGVTGRSVCQLMPDWPGWDRPHIMERHGGIIPTTPEILIEDARRWKKTQKKR